MTTYYEKLLRNLKNSDLDAMLIVPSEELKNIIGISPILCERFQGLFIKKNGENFYFCNLLTKSDLNHSKNCGNVYTWFDNDGYMDGLKKILNEHNLLGCTIGVNSKARAFNILDIMESIDIKFANSKNLIEEVNLIKSLDEIEKLKIVAKKTDEVMMSTIEFIKAGISEKDIYDKIIQEFKSRSCIPDFALVASGSNSALPHYNGNDRIIEDKDIVLLDIGAKYQGMSSDITRTIFVGEPTKKMREVYEIVLKSNIIGENAIAVDNSIAGLDNIARKHIEDAGYGQYFTTRLGHGIGCSTHEEPYVTKNSKKKIEIGMSFTIEPGIYIEDEFGIRIEDSVVVTDEGVEILNKLSKDMIIV
jgi:Xaa-Pro dipeptidase